MTLRRRKGRPIDRDHRVDMGQRLRSMYRNLGMQRSDATKFLQVSERTLHNWESGRHVIPFAVYKLLRLLNRMDLPGPDWDGWYFQASKLCSPEGRSFAASDASWLSLLVRRARMFDKLYWQNVQLRTAGAVPVPGPGCASDTRPGTGTGPAASLVFGVQWGRASIDTPRVTRG